MIKIFSQSRGVAASSPQLVPEPGSYTSRSGNYNDDVDHDSYDDDDDLSNGDDDYNDDYDDDNHVNDNDDYYCTF